MSEQLLSRQKTYGKEPRSTHATEYQLPFFLLLTYALSWWSLAFADGGILPHGPALAAVIVLITADKQRLREFWHRMTHWRAGWWYVIGPTIILGYQGAAFVINLLLGATTAQLPHLPPVRTTIELLALGGLWEEIGWSGYALPNLQNRFAGRPNGRLMAAVVLAVFRAVWHLPLFLYGKIFWFDVFVFEIAFQLLIAWLYNRSGGSVPAVMLFHFTSNIAGSVMSPVFAGAERTTYYALFMGLASLTALLIAWKSRFRPEQVQSAVTIP
jgi:hypothetical protein